MSSTLRPGQALFNALLEVDPSFAEEIRATENDPFYRDELIPAVLRLWRAHLEKTIERPIEKPIEV